MTKFSKFILRCEAETGSSKRPLNVVRNEEEKSNEVAESRTVSKYPRRNPRMQRYLFAVEYIGTDFCGSQKQKVGRTVVGVLEEAFHKFIGKPVSISISSRTDAGVHAVSNVCHVDIERISQKKAGIVLPPHEPTVVRRAVNHYLRKGEGDIMVTDVRCVPGDFHARFRAQERMYFYRILSGPESLTVFEKDRAWRVAEELNLCAMQEACKVLVGCHDFSSFRSSSCQAFSPIKTLDELQVSEVVSTAFFPSILENDLNNIIKDDSSACSKAGNDLLLSSISKGNWLMLPDVFGIRKKHCCYVIRVRARSFLYHQVRLIVGVLKAVGTGELTVSDVEKILKAKTSTAAPQMAPARGLYLVYVKYDLPEDPADTVETVECSGICKQEEASELMS